MCKRVMTALSGILIFVRLHISCSVNEILKYSYRLGLCKCLNGANSSYMEFAIQC